MIYYHWHCLEIFLDWISTLSIIFPLIKKCCSVTVAIRILLVKMLFKIVRYYVFHLLGFSFMCPFLVIFFNGLVLCIYSWVILLFTFCLQIATNKPNIQLDYWRHSHSHGFAQIKSLQGPINIWGIYKILVAL